MKECPVCKRPELTDGLERCPQCNADLECFYLLDALQGKPADQAPAPPKPKVIEERHGETGSRNGELHDNLVTSVPGTRKTGLAAGLALALLLLLVPVSALVGNRYLAERIDRLESRFTPAGNLMGASPQDWSRLYGAVQTLNIRMEGVNQQLSGLTTQQSKIVAEDREKQSKLEGGLSGVGERISRVEAQLATLGRRQDAGRDELKKTMTVLAASFPPLAGSSDFIRQQGVQPSPGGPSVTATPAGAPAFNDYHAAPSETLWRIARRFYGKGIYYPVLLEDNPGLAVHGPLDRRTIRIAQQREHAQETYRRLIYKEGGRTLFRYRAKTGDSWHSLARAFYGSERRVRELAGLNGTQYPETGRRVLIPLD